MSEEIYEILNKILGFFVNSESLNFSVGIENKFEGKNAEILMETFLKFENLKSFSL